MKYFKNVYKVYCWNVANILISLEIPCVYFIYNYVVIYIFILIMRENVISYYMYLYAIQGKNKIDLKVSVKVRLHFRNTEL